MAKKAGFQVKMNSSRETKRTVVFAVPEDKIDTSPITNIYIKKGALDPMPSSINVEITPA